MKDYTGMHWVAIVMLSVSGCGINAKAIGKKPDKKSTPLESNWDFSTSNDVSIVDWPPDMKNKNGIASLGGPQQISLKLANGITISAQVDEVSAEKRGTGIWWIALTFPNMTLKDAVDTAKGIVSILEYNSTRINEWYDQRAQERNPGPIFTENFRGKQYVLEIKLLHSYIQNRPWWTKVTIYLE